MEIDLASSAQPAEGGGRTIAARLNAPALRNREWVEDVLGITLRRESEGPFTRESGPSFQLDGLRVTAVDDRAPTAANPEVCPLLALDRELPRCITLDAIGTAFPEARITAMPCGSLASGPTCRSRPGAGKRSFGIAADELECLNTLVFTGKPSP
ncbi:hypothetical protein [Methylobacterium sp. ARG-1]|uniref:hypothetical protein n=1 Tax=Methylobacterium sp. ARG-1 TaxID=1692501 RepID=UPI000681264E|nr:hypothetical protein [Methylobacterium sp. ARG-1]KNY19747.1 hypothetical protein AKJ13_26290 [Methylobacterium sp. ARG-1]